MCMRRTLLYELLAQGQDSNLDGRGGADPHTERYISLLLTAPTAPTRLETKFLLPKRKETKGGERKKL